MLPLPLVEKGAERFRSYLSVDRPRRCLKLGTVVDHVLNSRYSVFPFDGLDLISPHSHELKNPIELLGQINHTHNELIA
jgi:hypothetical protein